MKEDEMVLVYGMHGRYVKYERDSVNRSQMEVKRL
jgi:hypothetical protein